MPDPRDLVSPSGQPLIKEHKLIIVKVPRGVHLPPDLMMQISKVTNCASMELPMDCEVMMGELAAKELESLHSAIHAILQTPNVPVSKTEVNILYSSMKFLCEKTNPGDNSKEVALLHKIKKINE